jgi:hypothetical protein
MLRDIIKQAGIALEEYYAQMQLMDLENERLRKKVFEKGKWKNQGKLTSGHAQHMTVAENLDFLACQDWESKMKDVFKEVASRFRILKKNILITRKRSRRQRRWLSERQGGLPQLLQGQQGAVVMVVVTVTLLAIGVE